MKKRSLLLIILILFIACGFGLYKYINSNPQYNKTKPEQELITESLDKYYYEVNKQHKSKFKIYNVKKFNNKCLVLAQELGLDGEPYINLFLLNDKFEVIKVSDSRMPITQCFSLDKVVYENNTILFGTFKDKRYDREADKQVPVDIKKVEVKFEDGSNIKESISFDNGYILIAKTTSDVNDAILYNENNDPQSNLSDLRLSDKLKNRDFNDYSSN